MPNRTRVKRGGKWWWQEFAQQRSIDHARHHKGEHKVQQVRSKPSSARPNHPHTPSTPLTHTRTHTHAHKIRGTKARTRLTYTKHGTASHHSQRREGGRGAMQKTDQHNYSLLNAKGGSAPASGAPQSTAMPSKAARRSATVTQASIPMRMVAWTSGLKELACQRTHRSAHTRQGCSTHTPAHTRATAVATRPAIPRARQHKKQWAARHGQAQRQRAERQRPTHSRQQLAPPHGSTPPWAQQPGTHQGHNITLDVRSQVQERP
jgi:hypothetical protein